MNDILKNLISTGALTTVLILLGRKIIEQLFSKDLEKYKSDLEKEASKSRIRYERLHAERAEVIKELYKRIARAYSSLQSLTNPLHFEGEPLLKTKALSAAEVAKDLISYHDENKIFLEESMAKEVDDFINIWTSCLQKFQFGQMSMSDGDKDNGMKDWHEAWKKISNEGLKVKEHIENKFRDILGIDEN